MARKCPLLGVTADVILCQRISRLWTQSGSLYHGSEALFQEVADFETHHTRLRPDLVHEITVAFLCKGALYVVWEGIVVSGGITAFHDDAARNARKFGLKIYVDAPAKIVQELGNRAAMVKKHITVQPFVKIREDE